MLGEYSSAFLSPSNISLFDVIGFGLPPGYQLFEKAHKLPVPVVANLWNMEWEELAFIVISSLIGSEIDMTEVNQLVRSCTRVSSISKQQMVDHCLHINNDIIARSGMAAFCGEFALRLISLLSKKYSNKTNILLRADQIPNSSAFRESLSELNGSLTVLYSSGELAVVKGKHLPISNLIIAKANTSSTRLTHLVSSLRKDKRFLEEKSLIVGGFDNPAWIIPKVACCFFIMKNIIQEISPRGKVNILLDEGILNLTTAISTAIQIGLPATLFSSIENSIPTPKPDSSFCVIIKKDLKTSPAPLLSDSSIIHIAPTEAAIKNLFNDHNPH